MEESTESVNTTPAAEQPQDWRAQVSLLEVPEGEEWAFYQVFGVSEEENDRISEMVNQLMHQGKNSHEIPRIILQQPWLSLRGWSCFLISIGHAQGRMNGAEEAYQEMTVKAMSDIRKATEGGK